MSYDVYDEIKLDNGDTLHVMDQAYNKNKREQLENPHEVAKIIKVEDNYLVILETPGAKEYIIEPYKQIEKHKSHKYTEDEQNDKIIKKISIPELGEDLHLEIRRGE